MSIPMPIPIPKTISMLIFMYMLISIPVPISIRVSMPMFMSIQNWHAALCFANRNLCNTIRILQFAFRILRGARCA